MRKPSFPAKTAKRRSAGIVVVRRPDSSQPPLFLILSAYGRWDFPKGGIEAGESCMGAAKREVAEETGIEELAFPWGEAYCSTPVYSHDKIAFYYLAETRQEEVLIRPNPSSGVVEHQEFRWVGPQELIALLPERLHGVISWSFSKLGMAPPSFGAPAERPSSSSARLRLS